MPIRCKGKERFHFIVFFPYTCELLFLKIKSKTAEIRLVLYAGLNSRLKIDCPEATGRDSRLIDWLRKIHAIEDYPLITLILHA